MCNIVVYERIKKIKVIFNLKEKHPAIKKRTTEIKKIKSKAHISIVQLHKSIKRVFFSFIYILSLKKSGLLFINAQHCLPNSRKH